MAIFGFELDEIARLIALVDTQDLDEFIYEEEGRYLRVRGPRPAPLPAAAPVVLPTAAFAAAVPPQPAPAPCRPPFRLPRREAACRRRSRRR